MPSPGDVKAGGAYVELGLDDKTRVALNVVGARFKALGTTLTSAARSLLLVGGAVAGPLLAAAKMGASAGAALYDMSKRTGIGTDALQRLGFVSEMTGGNMEELEKNIRRMQKSIAGVIDPIEGTTGSLRGLGLTAHDLKGMSPDQQFEVIGRRLAQIKDPTIRAAEAMKIFGRSGTQVLPMIEQLGRLEGIQKKLGIARSPEAIQNAKQLSVTWGATQMVIQSIGNTIGDTLTPALIKASAGIGRIGIAFRIWIANHRSLITTTLAVGVGLIGLGGALLIVGKAASIAGAALTGIMSIINGVSIGISLATSVIFSVPALIAAALVAGVAAFLMYTETGGRALKWLSDRFNELKAFVGEVIGGISDALVAGDVSLAAQILWAGLKVVFAEGKDKLMATWDTLWHGFLEVFDTVALLVEETFINMLTSVLNKLAVAGKTVAGFLGMAGKVLTSKGFASAGNLASAGAAAAGALGAGAAGLGKLNQAELTAAEKTYDEKIRALRASKGEDAAAAQKELDDAKKKLDDLRAQAHHEKEHTETGEDPFQALKDAFGNQSQGDFLDTIGKRTTGGTFGGGTAALALGSGTSLMERTAKATEQTQTNTYRLWQYFQAGNNSATGGTTFA